MMTSYNDDSHAEGVCVTAGFSASIRQWQKLEREWYSALKKHGLKSFHTVEAYSRHDEYWGKSTETIINDLIPIIARNISFGIGSIIDENAWNELLPEQIKLLGEPFTHWYMQGFNDAILVSLKYLEDNNFSDRIKFVFDPKDPIGPKVRDDFISSRKAVARRVRIIGEPTFESSAGLPGLQAADLLAWHLRRTYARGLHIDEDSVLTRLKVPMLYRIWNADHIRENWKRKFRVYQDLDQRPRSEITLEFVDQVREQAIKRVKTGEDT